MTSTYTDVADVELTAASGDPSVPAHPDPAVSSPSALGSADHKTVGRMFMGAAIVFGVIGLMATVAYQWAGVSDSWTESSRDAAFQLFTGGRLLLALGFAVPFLIGLGIFVVPLQVGARTVAFPRAAAMAFWTWLVATIMVIGSYGANGGIGGGNRDAQVLALTAVGLMVLALLLGAVCVATTAFGLRSPGMSLDRVPMFTWASMVSASIWLLTLPVWFANLLLIFLDARYGQPGAFGAVEAQWNQLAWLFSAPQVFAMAIPVLGIIVDSVTTVSGERMVARGWAMASIAGFGVLAIGAAVQPVLVADPYDLNAVRMQVILLLVPLFALLAPVLFTLLSGRRRAAPPALAGVVSWVVLALAGVSAVVMVSGLALTSTPDPLALPVQKLVAPVSAPVYTWGTLYLVLTAVVLGAVAGLTLWSSKVVGRAMPNSGSVVLVVLSLIGGLAAAVPMFVLAFADRTPSLVDARRSMLAVSSVGLAVLVLVLIVLGLLALARRPGQAATPDDPWGTGQSFEWLTSSPPASGNFGDLPVVHSAEPLLDAAEAESSH